MTGDGRLEVYRDKGGGYSWHKRAGNGEVVAQGQSHPRMTDAWRAATRQFPTLKVVVLDDEPAG